LSELDARISEPATMNEMASAVVPLPNLAFRTVTTMFLLYGMLFVFVVAFTEYAQLPPIFSIGITAVFLAIQYIFGPALLDWQISWFFKCDWVQPNQLPQHLQNFVQRVTKENEMKFPSFGIIRDSTPNAFTYGRYPSDARIVITQGLMDKLLPEELESVVAHEIGHAVHWDMALMTVAALVPIILYQIYRAFIRILQKSGGGGKKGGKGGVLIIAVGAYLCYVVSRYIILFLSRTREYHADAFSAEATKSSNSLASALVKVAYGLASDNISAENSRGEALNSEVQNPQREATTGQILAPLGIFDPVSAKALVTSTATVNGGDGLLNKDKIKDAMQWELWNPWAGWYELNSTHPLVAYRLDFLGKMSFKFGQKPFINFDRKQPESFWDEFAVDFIFLFIPWLTAFLLGLTGYFFQSNGASGGAIGGFILGLGLGNIFQTLFSYGFEFLPCTVASLLKQVKVSSIRTVPARLKGKIIGKGIPGYVFCEDMTFQDETGYLFLDYKQPLAIFEWWFAIASNSYIGREVVVEGWYKRSPIPSFEVYTIKPPTSSGSFLEKSKSYFFRFLFNVLLVISGALVVFGAL
ncbi:M48 family metalloprotease, partial [bacterium]|nr:M48 family metalloprotease [bacterium]